MNDNKWAGRAKIGGMNWPAKPKPESSPVLPVPSTAPPAPVGPAPLIGPTRVFEWLLVDHRIAKKVPADSRIWNICKGLVEHRAAGVESDTYVIDLLHASDEDRHFLLNRANWPTGD